MIDTTRPSPYFAQLLVTVTALLGALAAPIGGKNAQEPLLYGLAVLATYTSLLTIILGAGASYDSVADKPLSADPHPSRPPLTRELFATRSATAWRSQIACS